MTLKTGRWRSENQLGVKVIEYCKAIPDTPEWHTYQIQRVRSLRELKMKQLATEEQISAIANAILHNRTKEKKYHDPKITASSKVCNINMIRPINFIIIREYCLYTAGKNNQNDFYFKGNF